MASGFTTGRDQRGRAHQPVQPCRDCGEPMMWVTMPHSGKRNGLNLHPSADGDVLVVEAFADEYSSPWRIGVVLRDADMREEARELGLPIHSSHFATCPKRPQRPRPRSRADIDG